jgi:Mrp family chromosome partitioning ATPase
MDVLLHEARVPRLIADLRGDFDLIVIDGGTVHDAGHHWAPWVDAALLVCDASQSRSAEWASAWDLLEEKGTHVLGVIETNA